MAEFHERQDSNGGSFMVGLFTGALLGAGLGLLLAPKPGSELRRQLRTRAGELANTAEEGYRRAADTAGDLANQGRDLAERGREFGRDLYDRARDLGSEISESTERY